MSAHGRLLGVVPEVGALEREAAPARARTGTLSAHIGLAGVLLTGALLALSAARTNDLLPQSVRPIPGWLAGVFAHAGVPLGHATLIATFTVMFVSYVVAVRGAEGLSPRVVLATIAGLAALFLLAPVLLSTDIFSYQAYGRMGTLWAANPYLHGPSTIQLDPLYPFIGSKSVSTPTAYGPVFTALSYPFSSLDISASVAAYKSLAAFAFLATVGLVWNGARLRGLNPARAAMIVGLNPLTLVWGLGGGHNDLLMLAPLAAGLYVLLQDRQATGAAMLTVAMGIKLTAGLLLPFAFVRPRARPRRLLLGAGVASAAIAALGFAMFGTGQLNLLATLQHNQAAGDWRSIPGFISSQLGLDDGRSCRRRHAGHRLRRHHRLAATPGPARSARLDRRRGLGDARDVDHGKLAVALVHRLVDAAGRAQRRSPAATLDARDDRRNTPRQHAQLGPQWPSAARPVTRLGRTTNIAAP